MPDLERNDDNSCPTVGLFCDNCGKLIAVAPWSGVGQRPKDDFAAVYCPGGVCAPEGEKKRQRNA